MHIICAPLCSDGCADLATQYVANVSTCAQSRRARTGSRLKSPAAVLFDQVQKAADTQHENKFGPHKGQKLSAMQLHLYEVENVTIPRHSNFFSWFSVAHRLWVRISIFITKKDKMNQPVSALSFVCNKKRLASVHAALARISLRLPQAATWH